DGAGHPLGRAGPRAGLRGGDAGLGDEVHVGPGDPRDVGGQNDGAVHLRQLGEPLGAVLGIEQETPRADREHTRIVTHDDERPVFGLEYAVESFAKGGAGCDQRECVVQRLAATVDHTGIVLVRASSSVRTRWSTMPGGTPSLGVDAGTSARVKPARHASARRRSAPATMRTSPARPNSPKTTNSGGTTISSAAEATASATPR